MRGRGEGKGTGMGKGKGKEKGKGQRGQRGQRGWEDLKKDKSKKKMILSAAPAVLARYARQGGTPFTQVFLAKRGRGG